MSHPTNRSKSLIICTTPLQVLIAERIVALHPEEDFYAIILHESEPLSPKLKYYGDRLISQCSRGGCSLVDPFFRADFAVPKQIVSILKAKLQLRSFVQGVSKVYLASYEKVILRILLGLRHKDVSIYSFDDGLINLMSATYQAHKSYVGGRLYQLLGVPDASEVGELRVGHYTIYEGANAAYDNPTKIELFSLEAEEASSEISETVKLFLGQPVFEPDDEMSRAVTQEAIARTGCNYYLPHPREMYHIEGVQYIETNYIAEDYLLQELAKYPNRAYEIYSFFTTTMLNLQGHPRLRFVACRNSELNEKWEESYRVLQERAFPIIEL